jgi:hypothetical protein
MIRVWCDFWDCFKLFCCLWSLFYCWWISVELLGLWVFILLFMPYFFFMNRIGMSVVLWYWSLVNMSEGCCWGDPCYAGILTHVDSLEYVCWSRLPLVLRTPYILTTFSFGEERIGLHVGMASYHHTAYKKMSSKIFNSTKRLWTKETLKSFINSN